MNINERLLQYYLTSTQYFIDVALWFWETNDQFGNCGDEKIPFESDLYRRCERRLQAEGGYRLYLKDSIVQDYFTNISDNNILFAVIFAHWLRLSEGQIANIRNVAKASTAWKRLQRYILNPQTIYRLYINGKEMPATKDEMRLISEDGKIYEIN